MIKKKFIITNVKVNEGAQHTLTNTTSGDVRNKLTVLNVIGLCWQEKKKLIQTELMNAFGTIPNGVTFTKRKTIDVNNNPDGFRIFVYCCWIKRNRFHDNYGKFEVGRLIKAINKQIKGSTKKHILLKKKK